MALPALGSDAMGAINALVKMQSKQQTAPSKSAYGSRFSAGAPEPPRSARSVLTRNSFQTATSLTRGQGNVSVPADFSSDVGRRHFGFSHEELDDSTAYYEGQFKLFQRCGEGVLHNPETGSKYVGQFQEDQFHGDGDQTWSDGSRYRGKWVSGQKHGHGEYTSADSLRYVGQWEGGRRHGQGTQEYANRDKYVGSWINGLCNGVGTYFFADGARYEGIWAQGRYDGCGMYYGSDGTRERLVYNTGLLMKREIMTPGAAPRAGRRNLLGGKVLMDQERGETHKPILLPKPQTSRFLIRRDSAGVDLSAPPLKPKTAPARLGSLEGATSEAGGLDGTTPRFNATAPGRLSYGHLGDDD